MGTTTKEPKQVDLIRLVLSGKDVSAPDAQRAKHQANRALGEAASEVKRLKDRRRTLLVDGTPEDLLQLDELVKAQELEVERYTEILKLLRPIRERAEQAVQLEKAKDAAARLPALLESAFRARQNVAVTTAAVRQAADLVLRTGYRLDDNLRNQIEHLLEGPIQNTGLSMK